MTEVYYKVSQVLQSASGITKCDRLFLQSTSGITKFDSSYKVKHNIVISSMNPIKFSINMLLFGWTLSLTIFWCNNTRQILKNSEELSNEHSHLKTKYYNSMINLLKIFLNSCLSHIFDDELKILEIGILYLAWNTGSPIDNNCYPKLV